MNTIITPGEICIFDAMLACHPETTLSGSQNNAALYDFASGCKSGPTQFGYVIIGHLRNVSIYGKSSGYVLAYRDKIINMV